MRQCKRVYPIKDDIPVMLIDEATIDRRHRDSRLATRGSQNVKIRLSFALDRGVVLPPDPAGLKRAFPMRTDYLSSRGAAVGQAISPG